MVLLLLVDSIIFALEMFLEGRSFQKIFYYDENTVNNSLVSSICAFSTDVAVGVRRPECDTKGVLDGTLKLRGLPPATSLVFNILK